MKDLINFLENFIEFGQVTELMKNNNSVSFKLQLKQFLYHVYLEHETKDNNLFIMITDTNSKLQYVEREKITNKHNITRLFIRAINKYTKIRKYEFELKINCNY